MNDKKGSVIMNNKIEEFMNTMKLNELIHKKKMDDEKKNTIIWVLAIIGAIAAIAAISYSVYRYFTPDYFDDFDDDYDDDFDDNYWDEEEEELTSAPTEVAPE